MEASQSFYKHMQTNNKKMNTEQKEKVTTNNKTNIIDKNKTNVIDKNKTNVIDKNKTNVIDKNKTNVIDKNKTNIIDNDKTNVIDNDKTNVIDKNKTNVIDNDKTNVMNNKNNKNKQGKKEKQNSEPKVMYYSFEITEYDKILEIIKDNLECEYSSIIEKKIIKIVPKQLKNKSDDVLEDAFKNLNVIENEDVDKCIENEYKEIEKHLKDKDNGIILIDNVNGVYKINEKFHITMLFLKGTEDEIEKKAKIEEKIGDECIIKIKSIGHSEDFIVLGIEFDEDVMPYYGNEIKHITIGLRKTIDGKKLFPKDSPTALNGFLIEFGAPIEIKGVITKIMNK
jgi:hypothetical protein